MDYKLYRIETMEISDNIEIEYEMEKIDSIEYIHIKVKQKEKQIFPILKFRICIPAVEIHYRWTPKLNLIKALNLDWFQNLYLSNGYTGAPVECLINSDDKNCWCIALSETLESVGITTLPVEETAEYGIEVTLFINDTKQREEYNLTVRLDNRCIPYYEALNYTAEWWEKLIKKPTAFVPEIAKELMYSTWYSYHQDIKQEELIKECQLAYELGCKTIIIDDGWQTEDNNRGYAFCGDWQVSKTKIPDINAFVNSIHQIGMKVIFWYSVPFIGEKSTNFATFNNMLIDPLAEREWHVLDPRYKKVREFIIQIYEKALKEWDLDGFKLDFIDEFVVTPYSGKLLDNSRDFTSFTKATDCLMTECINRLKGIKPDVLLEFRQTYNGPRMRTYGNIFRAVDCPMGDVENKERITDIRLLANNSAVHSDMIMWNNEDSVESAALQIIQILFSVPQISMKIDELNKEHYKMLKFYCSLWTKYKDAFVNGKFEPLHAANRYSLIKGIYEDTMVCTYFIAEPIEILCLYKEMVFVNGSNNDVLIIYNTVENKNYTKRIFDCMGENILKEKIILKKGFNVIHVPKSGTAHFL